MQDKTDCSMWRWAGAALPAIRSGQRPTELHSAGGTRAVLPSWLHDDELALARWAEAMKALSPETNGRGRNCGTGCTLSPKSQVLALGL